MRTYEMSKAVYAPLRLARAIIETAALFVFVAAGRIGDRAAPAMVEPLSRFGQLRACHTSRRYKFLPFFHGGQLSTRKGTKKEHKGSRIVKFLAVWLPV